MKDAISGPAPEVQTLLREYERVSADIRVIETMNDKVVGFGIAIVGAGFAYGIQQQLWPVFFFLPLGLLGVLFYATLQYHNMFWFGGYKRALEETINELSGRPLLHWEALIETRRRRINIVNTSLILVYVVLVISAVLYSVFQIFAHFSTGVAFAYALLVISFVVLLFFSVRHMFGAVTLSYTATRELLNPPPDTAKTNHIDVKDQKKRGEGRNEGAQRIPIV